MAWNGAGTFNRLYSWATDALNGLAISSSRMDAELDGFKNGLENVVTRDGQNQPLANLPMAGLKHTGVGAATARDQYAQVGQVQDTSFMWGGTAGGTANALTISVTPAITAYVAGQTFRFIVASVNTTAATLAVNGLTATAIVKEGGTALAAGDLPVGVIAQVTYSGSDFRLNRTTGTSLADVLHTTGNESRSGVLTFTAASASPIFMSSINPTIEGQNTALALPAGLWRCYLPSNDDKIYFVKNTHASGNFSTSTVAFDFSTALATFAGQVALTDGTASNRAVSKGQLDAKVYGGQVTNAGTAAIPYGPSGWTVSRAGVGNTTVTHNLGTASYSVTASMAGGSNHGMILIGTIGTNSFQILTVNTAGAVMDTAYNFTLVRN